ncbi:MAG: hypothetical protein ACXACI_18400 [Candidatus Hodarchaeales archaeon]|jgi:hypothetical protein
MKKTQISSMGVLLLGVMLLGAIPTATTEATQVRMDRSDPFRGMETGQLMQAMRDGFFQLLLHMKDANFSDGTVLYDYFEPGPDEPITRTIDNSGSVEQSFDVARLNQTLSRIYEALQLRGYTDAAASFAEAIAELEGHTSLDVSKTWDIDIERTFESDARIVVIFWDNDSSVIDKLEMIKNNDTAGGQSQPFTGDEIFTVVRLTTNQESFSGSRTISIDWTYEDGSDATLLRELITRLSMPQGNFTRVWRGDLNLNALRLWLGPQHESFDSTINGTRERFWASFDVSQLRIRELLLGARPNMGLFVKSFAYTYLEHHMLSTLVYNDTNGNGIMDLEMDVLPGGRVPVPVSNETLYRLDLTGIGSKQYFKPETTNDILSFGFSFGDVAGNFLPYDRDTDSTTINPTANDAIPTTFDKFTVMMHFSKDAPKKTANLKFDYVIGELDDPAVMDGLSLSQNFVTTLINSDTIHRVNRIEAEDGNEVEPEGNMSRRIRRVRFRAGTDDSAEIRLDDIPYTWDGTEEVNATGQLVPISLIGVMYGQAAMEGEWMHRMRGLATAQTFMYSISYPEWSGLSISHDPTFTLTSGDAAGAGSIDEESSEAAAEDGFAPGFEFLGVLLVLGSLPILRARRNSSRKE